MKKLFIIFIFSINFLLLTINDSFAVGQAGQENPILELGVGARALGMGGSFISISDDANSVYWNPAGLSQVQQKEITTMQSDLFLGTQFYYVSYVMPIEKGVESEKFKVKSAIGVSWMQLTSKDIKKTEIEKDANGNPVIDTQTGKYKVKITGLFNSVDNAYLIGYGKRLTELVLIGCNVKFLTRELGKKGTGIGFDFGVLYKFNEKFNIAFVGQDITETQVKWETGNTDVTQPTIKLGISSKLVDKEDNSLTVTGDISQKIKGEHNLIYHIGSEWLLANIIALRVGYDDTNLTAGAGFIMKLDGCIFLADYAYMTHKEFDNTHRISLSVKF